MREGFVRGIRTPEPKGELELVDRPKCGRAKKLSDSSWITLDASSSTTVFRDQFASFRESSNLVDRDVQSSGKSLVSESRLAKVSFVPFFFLSPVALTSANTSERGTLADLSIFLPFLRSEPVPLSPTSSLQPRIRPSTSPSVECRGLRIVASKSESEEGWAD